MCCVIYRRCVEIFNAALREEEKKNGDEKSKERKRQLMNSAKYDFEKNENDFVRKKNGRSESVKFVKEKEDKREFV